MAVLPLFLPRTGSFSGLPGAGSGTLAQWTYTVPNGRKATLNHSYLLIDLNAAAANTLFAIIVANIGGVAIRAAQINGSGFAVPTFNSFIHNIELSAADFIQGISINTSAVNPFFIIQCAIKEYQ